MSVGKRGILQRMGHIRDMYTLVRWVDNDIKGHDASTPEVAKRGDKYRVSGAGIRENYVRVSGKGDAGVRDLIESCREEGFLKTEDDVWYIINPAKGRRLLRKAGPIPSGFLKEVFNDNYIVWSFLSGLVGGLIPLLIYILSGSP